jgi:hypothetical protein
MRCACDFYRQKRSIFMVLQHFETPARQYIRGGAQNRQSTQDAPTTRRGYNAVRNRHKAFQPVAPTQLLVGLRWSALAGRPLEQV